MFFWFLEKKLALLPKGVLGRLLIDKNLFWKILLFHWVYNFKINLLEFCRSLKKPRGLVWIIYDIHWILLRRFWCTNNLNIGNAWGLLHLWREGRLCIVISRWTIMMMLFGLGCFPDFGAPYRNRDCHFSLVQLVTMRSCGMGNDLVHFSLVQLLIVWSRGMVHDHEVLFIEQHKYSNFHNFTPFSSFWALGTQDWLF